MNKCCSYNRLFALLLLLALPYELKAQTTLSEEALFYRCYAQLTQQRPKVSDARVAQVKAGTKTAIQACTEVLDSARFTASNGTKIADDTDAVAKAVLNSFHQLHRSWSRDFDMVARDNDNQVSTGTNVWYENNPMGAYVTRALFSPEHDVTTVISGNDYLQPVRTTMDPPHTAGGVPNPSPTRPTDWRLGSAHPFAPRGELLGIRSVSLAPISVIPPVAVNAMPDFANAGLDPAASQSFTTINFPDVTALSAPIGQVTQFAIRFRGTLNIPVAGQYTFFIDADDIGSLIIDGNRVTATRTSGTPIALTVGAHTLEIHYLQRTTTARLIFSWQGPSFTKQIVPASALTSVVGEYYTQTQAAPIQLTGNEGGGFIGNHNYLMVNFTETSGNFVPDGQLKTNRSYARAVLSDTLCREVPVVRESDATQFVVPTSTSPFRQEAACSACHATLDRIAGGAIRGLRWNVLNGTQPPLPQTQLFGIAGVKMIKPFLGADTTWPATLDADYGNRAPYGHFYFRNFRGELVDTVIQSIPDLAASIKQQDDYYTCFAKRYYHYFLGIDVELGDPGDPSYPQLNVIEEYQRAKAISLGSKLRQHKSLRQLILDIISSEEYRMSNFGVSYGGPDNG